MTGLTGSPSKASVSIATSPSYSVIPDRAPIPQKDLKGLLHEKELINDFI
jgi:hypothetical protein